MDLSALIAPLSVQDFLTEVLSRRAQVLPGSSERFAHLLPWPALNQLLQRHRFDAGRLRIAKDGTRLSPDTYNAETPTFPERPALAHLRHRELDPVAVQQQLRDGATLQISAIDELYEPIGRLAAVMEAAVRERVYVDAFVSWGSTRGYKKHWDDSDAFIVQVHGTKKWQIWAPTMANPDHRDHGRPAPPPYPPREFLLTAGDAAHLPRGWWHMVTPADDVSVHLAFSFTRRTGHDFLTWALEDFRAHSDVCRRDIPIQLPDADPGRDAAELNQALTRHLSDPSLVHRFLQAHQAAQHTRRGFSLHPAADCDVLSRGNTVVAWLAPLAVRENTPTSTTVTAAGQRHAFAPHVDAVAQLLSDCAPRTLKEIQELSPDLPADELTEIIRQFVATGLAVAEQADL